MSFECEGMPVLDFYQIEDLSIPSLHPSLDLSDYKYVSIQSAAEFYRHSNYLITLKYKMIGNSKKINNLPNCESHAVIKKIDLSGQHIPNSNHFVVYILKKKESSVILRFYQCLH